MGGGQRKACPRSEGLADRADNRTVRVGLYARVSTDIQSAESQVEALEAYAAAQGWMVRRFVDHGVSGARERRPGLDHFSRRYATERSTRSCAPSWTVWHGRPITS